MKFTLFKNFNEVINTVPVEQIVTEIKEYQRYKYNGTAWVYEYSLNNSSFTAAQWATINSGLTSTSLNDYYTKTQVDSELDDKVDKITGKQLSTEDYTSAEKTKLAGLSNYDDTEIKGDISDLETNKQDISTLDDDVEALGYLKQHQSLDNYYTKAEDTMKTAFRILFAATTRARCERGECACIMAYSGTI